MSSFGGRMKEYPTISLDRFDKENLHARAFFLSHCHKDHMKGFKASALRRKLQLSLTVKLYCSPVSKEILLSHPKYGFWENHIVALELEDPTKIPLVDEISGEKEDILVTLIPAGHCPGSVMFLIEGNHGTVLYTGDFRLAEGQAAQIEALHTGSGVKDVQSVYLDTTFCDPEFFHIPSREACLDGIRELVREWIAISAYHVVWLNCNAAYGYEYLFVNLSEEFGCQIHVRSTRMFRKMPEILCHVTTSHTTQIHACRHSRGKGYLQDHRLPCGMKAPDGTPLQVISIKPSTMWFGEMPKKATIIVKTGPRSYKACFSFHSSYSEIKDFLSYICPVTAHPNVIPSGKTLTDIEEILKPMCREQCRQGLMVYKPLGTLKRSKVERIPKDSECDLFDDEDLTPWRRKLPVRQQPDSQGAPIAKTAALETRFQKDTELTHVAGQLKENFLDCAESNDEEDTSDEEDDGLASQNSPDEEQNKRDASRPEAQPPSWDAFFSVESDLTDESQELKNSQTRSTELGTSQSPRLFSDSDDDATHISSQSTHISDPGTGSQSDTVLIQPTESVQRDGRNPGHEEDSDTGGIPMGNEEEKPASQVSSDFEIPPTPESRAPQIEDLKEMYRKLAAGEMLFKMATKERQ